MLMKNNLFLETSDSKAFALILEHNHGKIQAAMYKAYIQ
jgi:hypothetical protein